MKGAGGEPPTPKTTASNGYDDSDAGDEGNTMGQDQIATPVRKAQGVILGTTRVS